jgi:hypothetical protein
MTASIGERRRWLLAWAAPVLTVAVAWLAWWVSDRLGGVGPLDKAAFGWLVPIPLLFAAPVVGGLAWRRLDERSGFVAGLLAGGTVAAAVALLFWNAVIQPGCETAPTRTPAEWILPSLLAGALVGGGLLLGGIAATRLFQSGQRLAAVVAAVVLDGAVLAVALVVLGVILSTPGCERPVVGG